MSSQDPRIFVPIKESYPELLAGVFDIIHDSEGKSFLDRVSITSFSIVPEDEQIITRISLEILGESVLDLPVIDAIALSLGDSTRSSVSFQIEITISEHPKVRILNLEPRLLLSSDFFKPVRRSKDGRRFILDTTRKPEIPLGTYNIEINADNGFRLMPRSGAPTSFNLAPVALGNTGLVLEASGISVFLDPNNPPPGKPSGWRGCFKPQLHGMQIIIQLPDLLEAT
jgi:hypothetical protein